MVRSTIGTLTALLTLLLAADHSASAIMIDQIDDFQDGTTAGWRQGIQSPNPTENVATGGPAGEGDAYLRNVSTGFGLEGSQMVMFNSNQWTGDYTEQGVVRIVADMLNEGQNDLLMRVAIGSGSANARLATWYASTDPVPLLAADEGWHRGLSFPVTEESLTLVTTGTGTIPLAEALVDVTLVRILSSTEPDFRGDAIAATLGVDNIAARAGGSPFLLGDMNGNGVVGYDDVDPFVLALNDPAGYAAAYQMLPARNGDTDGDNDFDFDDAPGFIALVDTGTGLLGDVNLDAAVNGLDVDPFVTVLLTGPYQVEADMNQDTVVNGLDVDPFVAAIVGGGLRAVPEPSGLILAIAGLATLGLLGGGARRCGNR